MQMMKKERADAPLSLTEEIIAENSSGSAMEVPLRLRVTKATEQQLNRAEAYFQGNGWRHVTRSHIIRLAIERTLADVIKEHPEIDVPTAAERASSSDPL